MKVLQLIPSLENRAPVNFAIDLAIALQKTGIEVDICYVKSKFSRTLPCGIKSFPLSASVIIKSDYDIVHSHMLKPNIVSLLFWRAKLVSTIHSDMWFDISDSHGKFKSKIITYFWIKALKYYDMNACLSQHHLRLYSATLKNLACVPNGIRADYGAKSIIDCDVRSIISTFQDPGNTLFSVGAFRKLKGLEQIVILLGVDASKRCVFFGDGPELEYIKELAVKSGVDERCLFLGFVDKPYLYFEFCSALLIVSRSEGFPLSLLEAIRHKVPLVCSDIPAFDEMFDNNLYKFKLDDVMSLKRCLDLAMLDADRVAKLYDMFICNNTIEKVAERYSDIYLNNISEV